MDTIIGNSRDYFFGRILPDGGICAEIGVRTGDNADRILNLSNPKKLYLVDPWNWFKVKNVSDPEHMSKTYDMEEWYQRVKNKFKNNSKVEIIREVSVDASKQFKDEFFDWVYIDAAHDYLSVMEDCEAWWPKIKKGGYICGHDYRINEEKEGGVTKAVKEFIKKYNLELYYKGDENGDTSEWCALKKDLNYKTIIEDSKDLRSKFYENLYDELYNYSNNYKSSLSWKWSQHYGGLVEGVLNPSGIKYRSLLDIGCANGVGLTYFKEQGKEVYGIDVSKDAIDIAIKRGLNCKVASATKIPYPDNFVDAIVSTETMEHLKPEDQETAFKEMFRVSKKYVAHQISVGPEVNSGKNIHLTCWNQHQWNEFIDKLNLEWDIIYSLTEENWEKVRHNVYSNKKDYKGESFAYYKPDNWSPEYQNRLIHVAYLVLEKRNIK